MRESEEEMSDLITKPLASTSSTATVVSNTATSVEQIKQEDDVCSPRASVLSESNAKIEQLKKETKLLSLGDDNEKENDLKQIDTGEHVMVNNLGQEEIVDGFSFLTFEFESDFKVRSTVFAYSFLLFKFKLFL